MESARHTDKGRESIAKETSAQNMQNTTLSKRATSSSSLKDETEDDGLWDELSKRDQPNEME